MELADANQGFGDGQIEAFNLGDAIEFSENGYEIKHIKSIYSFPEAKATQIERLKLIRNQKELEPIEYNGHYYDADKDSLLRLDKARQSLEDNGLESIEWTTANNERVNITIADFKGINTAIAARSNQLHIRYNELKTFINSIEDEKYGAAIFRIQWDSDISQGIDSFMEIVKTEGESTTTNTGE